MNRVFYHRCASPLGGILLASDGERLCGLWFEGQNHMPEGAWKKSEDGAVALPIFTETVRWLDLYFGGGIPDFTPPLLLEGTAFQKAVWKFLLTIPYGGSVSYGTMAERMGRARQAARAIGSAVGHNPISIIVPCHRVLGAAGELTGYAGGIGRKRKLLELEQATVQCLHGPS